MLSWCSWEILLEDVAFEIFLANTTREDITPCTFENNVISNNRESAATTGPVQFRNKQNLMLGAKGGM